MYRYINMTAAVLLFNHSQGGMLYEHRQNESSMIEIGHTSQALITDVHSVGYHHVSVSRITYYYLLTCSFLISVLKAKKRFKPDWDNYRLKNGLFKQHEMKF